MDDLQFRRSLYADPNNRDDDLKKALSEDPIKQKFANEISALEEKIFNALDVPVPDDLAKKLLLKQTFASHKQQKRKSRIQLALAASVAITFGITFSLMQFSHTYKTISDYAIAHVNHEAEYFHNDDKARVSLAKLNQKMSAFNGVFSEQLGELIAANYCRFDGVKSLHLVLKGQSSPVNIFIVPKNKYLKVSDYFENESMQGLVNNFYNNNIIIVGDKSEPLKKWQAQINQKVRIST